MQHRRHLLIAPLLLLLLVVCGDAFIVDSSSRRLTPLIVRTSRGDGTYATHLFMFDNDKKGSSPPLAPPLETVDTLSSTTTTDQPMNLVKDKNTGKVVEVKWVDPAMSANENPFNMGWYVFRTPNHHSCQPSPIA
jgi:hypothetical protein